MKNKNNPKSKKLARQSRALARLRHDLACMTAAEVPTANALEHYIPYAKSQIAILEAKGVK